MNIEDDSTYTLKLLIVGDYGVGKTSFITQFVDKTFYDKQPPTIGIDFKTKMIKIQNNKMKVQLWDTVGQEKYDSVATSLLPKANGIILMFDITNYDSFSNLKKWIEIINEKCDKANILIVGNKSDLNNKRCVSQEDIQMYLNVNETYNYKEVSSKTGTGINEAIKDILKLILSKEGNSFMSLTLNESVINSNSCSCFVFR